MLVLLIALADILHIEETIAPREKPSSVNREDVLIYNEKPFDYSVHWVVMHMG